MRTRKYNIMIRRAIAVAVCCVAIITQARAQGLTIELDGGLQGTQYQLLNGQNKLLPAGSLGLLYTFELGRNWGLITGITGGVYRTQATLPNGTIFSNYQVDDEGSAFHYSMKTEGYKETQQFLAAGVPLLLQFHTAGAGTQWYFNGGGKVMFPSSDNAAISAQQLNLSGYYPDYNVTLSNLPQHGFGTITNWKASTTAVLKPAAAFIAATGLSFGLVPQHPPLYRSVCRIWPDQFEKRERQHAARYLQPYRDNCDKGIRRIEYAKCRTDESAFIRVTG